MKKRVFGRQFKRDVNERKALFKGLISSLVMHERIQTTEEKAKSVRGTAEKLVTKAMKKDRLTAYSLLQPHMTADAVNKMMNSIAPRFVNRAGGYTRIIRIGKRFNDNASMVMLEWVEKAAPVRADQVPEKAEKKDAVEAKAEVAKPKKAAKKTAAKTEKKVAKPKAKVAKKEKK